MPDSVIAVDFGTTATCVATCAAPGSEVHIINHQGAKGSRLPSGVMWRDGQLLVGSLAFNQANLDPAAYDDTPKRALTEGDRTLLLGDADVSAVDVLTAILREATRPGLAQLGGSAGVWVLTHPAAWGSSQLEVLRAAGARAGGSRQVLMSEPVAAAWGAHQADLAPGSRVAVFDWGGGTFDAAVLEWDGSEYAQIGPAAGRDPLGGEDVDDAVTELVLPRLPEDVRARIEQPKSSRDRRLVRELRLQARIAKETLSDSASADLVLSALEDSIRITLGEFNAVATPIVEQCVAVLRGCLAGAGVGANDLTAVYLVGDSSRTPLVHTLLSRELPGVLVIPAELGKEAVARGSALATTREPSPSGAVSKSPPKSPPPSAAKSSPASSAPALKLDVVRSQLAMGLNAMATVLKNQLPHDLGPSSLGELTVFPTSTLVCVTDDRRSAIQLVESQSQWPEATLAEMLDTPQHHVGRDDIVGIERGVFLGREVPVLRMQAEPGDVVKVVCSPHHSLRFEGCSDDVVEAVINRYSTFDPMVNDFALTKYQAGLPLVVPPGYRQLEDTLEANVECHTTQLLRVTAQYRLEFDSMSNTQIAGSVSGGGRSSSLPMFGVVAAVDTTRTNRDGQAWAVLRAGAHVGSRAYRATIEANWRLKMPLTQRTNALARAAMFAPYLFQS